MAMLPPFGTLITTLRVQPRQQAGKTGGSDAPAPAPAPDAPVIEKLPMWLNDAIRAREPGFDGLAPNAYGAINEDLDKVCMCAYMVRDGA